MERLFELGMLLDRYEPLLTERQAGILRQYTDENCSLAEIAEREGISRQGVRATLKRAEEQLRFYEEKLGLAAHFAGIRERAGEIVRLAAALSRSDDSAARDAAKEIAAAAESIISLF